MIANQLTAQKALQQYGAQRQQQANEAAPHEMIAMLFDGAINALNKMLWFIEHSETEQRGKAASKAIAIVNGMRDCLDMQVGGELAENLYSVYSFIAKDLLRANYENDAVATQESLRILRTIKESWDHMPQAQVGSLVPEANAAPVLPEPATTVPAQPSIPKPALGLRRSAFYS